MFSIHSDNFTSIQVHIFEIINLFTAEFEEPKIGIWSKVLIKYNT